MKSIFPKEIFQSIQKKDGYISLVFINFYFLFAFLYSYTLKDFLSNQEIVKEIRRLVTGIGFYILPLVIIIIILKIRKQSLTTIGLRRRGCVISIVIGLVLSTIVFLVHLKNNRPIDVILFNLIFYVLILGFSEEIIFRGFLWPRLVVLLGERVGTVLSGVFFGIMHAPIKIILDGSPIIMSFLNEVGGGIIGSIMFIFIYTRNNNIILPSMIHGVLDFMA